MTPALPPEFLTRPLAHRGLHDIGKGIPENSRAAFEAAITAGYGIELDVQQSSDGHAMVFHDYELERLSPETGLVRRHSRAELRRFPLLGSKETIPDLDEVLDLVAARTPILIEIKDLDGARLHDVGPLEMDVARAVKDYAGPVAVMSFNPHAVEVMASAAPQIPRGLTTCDYQPVDWPDLPEEVRMELREVPHFDHVGASFVSHMASDLGRPRITELKSHGARILCWTIKNQAQEDAARKIAHNITFEGYLPKIPTP